MDKTQPSSLQSPRSLRQHVAPPRRCPDVAPAVATADQPEPPAALPPKARPEAKTSTRVDQSAPRSHVRTALVQHRDRSLAPALFSTEFRLAPRLHQTRCRFENERA